MTDRTKDTWPWPVELDALVAAPEYHALLFENEHVRVLETHAGPGDTVPVHTHCWPAILYILSTSDFVRRNPEGDVLLDTRETHDRTPVGSSVWGEALPPHSLENVGTHEMRNITVELKHLR
jgi:hypothetical protein